MYWPSPLLWGQVKYYFAMVIMLLTLSVIGNNFISLQPITFLHIAYLMK